MSVNMKKKKNISISLLIAFLANLLFAAIEFIGGGFAKSSAIISDAFHDSVDALFLGIALILEQKSKQKPNQKYTYGYKRYSIISAFIMGLMLVGGSAVIIYHSITRLVNYNNIVVNGEYMMITACIGLVLNGIAYLATYRRKNLNESAVHLHMLEDWLGLVIVLLGSIIIMSFPNLTLIDPILSILASGYIIIHALIHIKSAVGILLEKTPKGFDCDNYFARILKLDGVIGMHHFHIWQLNESCFLTTMHVNVDENITADSLKTLRNQIQQISEEFHISHETIEFEFGSNTCDNTNCIIKEHHHHHHHHH